MHLTAVGIVGQGKGSSVHQWAATIRCARQGAGARLFSGSQAPAPHLEVLLPDLVALDEALELHLRVHPRGFRNPLPDLTNEVGIVIKEGPATQISGQCLEAGASVQTCSACAFLLVLPAPAKPDP